MSASGNLAHRIREELGLDLASHADRVLRAVLEYEGFCTRSSRSLQKRGQRLIFVLQGRLPPAGELLREMVAFTPALFRPAGGYPGTAAWYEQVDGRWLLS